MASAAVARRPSIDLQDQVLLGEFDELPHAPAGAPVVESRWVRWRGRVVAASVVGVGLAMRVVDYSTWTNGIASFAIGSGVQAFIEGRHKKKSLEQIHRITLTAFGIMTFTAFTYFYNNTRSWGHDVQAFEVHSCLGILGANCWMFAKRLYEQGFVIRTEANAETGLAGEKFGEGIIPPKVAMGLKVCAVAALATLANLSSVVADPKARGLLSFLAALYGGQIPGYIVFALLHRLIQKNDRAGDRSENLDLQGTKYRKWQNVALTVGWLAIPLIFAPWSANPGDVERLIWLPIMGAISGFFDQIQFDSENERLENVPIHKLTELLILNPPGESEWVEGGSDPDKRPLRLKAYRIWRVAYPALATVGLTAFVAWQTGWKLNTLEEKLPLAMKLAGFVGTFALANVVDWTWDPTRRHYFRDKLMTSLLIAPRIFGINPLYIYLGGVNTLMINNNAAATANNLELSIIAMTSLAEGSTAALELWRTWGRRRGAIFMFPLMVVINAIYTAKFSLFNERNVP